MKNRNEIRRALILSLEDRIRSQCMLKGKKPKDIEDFIIIEKENTEKIADTILQDYDNYLISHLADELASKLVVRTDEERAFIADSINGVINKISTHQEVVLNDISNISNFNRIIRIKTLEEEIDTLQNECGLILKHKDALDKLAASQANRVSWLFVFISVISTGIWCTLIYKKGWDEMEKWTYISALIIIVINAVYFAIFEKNLLAETMRDQKLKEQKNYVYNLYKYDIECSIKISETLETKKKELTVLKEAVTNNAWNGKHS